MNVLRLVLAIIIAAPIFIAAADAQQVGHDDSSMPGMAHGTVVSSPAAQEMMNAMTKMDDGMKIAPSGNTDRDFVAMMIPHHQGAIDMARVELKYGKDPALRRLANAIVSAQKKEIREMQRWQATHSGH